MLRKRKIKAFVERYKSKIFNRGQEKSVQKPSLLGFHRNGFAEGAAVHVAWSALPQGSQHRVWNSWVQHFILCHGYSD